MTLLQLFIIWLLFGAGGVTLDLMRQSTRDEYKGMDLFQFAGMTILFILGGAMTFVMALHDFIEYKKKEE